MLSCVGGGETLRTYRPLILMEINRGYYQCRNLQLNDLFMPLLPPDYRLYAFRKGWQSIASFDDCHSLEDIYLVPAEQIGKPGYQQF